MRLILARLRYEVLFNMPPKRKDLEYFPIILSISRGVVGWDAETKLNLQSEEEKTGHIEKLATNKRFIILFNHFLKINIQ